VLVDKRFKDRLEDVNVLSSWGGIISSDHFLVVARRRGIQWCPEEDTERRRTVKEC
jgi:hypothetical protein